MKKLGICLFTFAMISNGCKSNKTDKQPELVTNSKAEDQPITNNNLENEDQSEPALEQGDSISNAPQTDETPPQSSDTDTLWSEVAEEIISNPRIWCTTTPQSMKLPNFPENTKLGLRVRFADIKKLRSEKPLNYMFNISRLESEMSTVCSPYVSLVDETQPQSSDTDTLWSEVAEEIISNPRIWCTTTPQSMKLPNFPENTKLGLRVRFADIKKLRSEKPLNYMFNISRLESEMSTVCSPYVSLVDETQPQSSDTDTL